MLLTFDFAGILATFMHFHFICNVLWILARILNVSLSLYHPFIYVLLVLF